MCSQFSTFTLPSPPPLGRRVILPTPEHMKYYLLDLTGYFMGISNLMYVKLTSFLLFCVLTHRCSTPRHPHFSSGNWTHHSTQNSGSHWEHHPLFTIHIQTVTDFCEYYHQNSFGIRPFPSVTAVINLMSLSFPLSLLSSTWCHYHPATLPHHLPRTPELLSCFPPTHTLHSSQNSQLGSVRWCHSPAYDPCTASHSLWVPSQLLTKRPHII